MIAHFVRLFVGWVVGWLVLMLVAYSLLVPANAPGVRMACEDCNMNLMTIRYEATFALDKPWPLNYLSWIVGSNGEVVREYTDKGHYVLGGEYVPTTTYQFVRARVLGDVPERTNILGLAGWFVCSVLVLMAVTVFRRIGHRPYS